MTSSIKLFEIFANGFGESKLGTNSAADSKALQVKNGLDIENLNGDFFRITSGAAVAAPNHTQQAPTSTGNF